LYLAIWISSLNVIAMQELNILILFTSDDSRQEYAAFSNCYQVFGIEQNVTSPNKAFEHENKRLAVTLDTVGNFVDNDNDEKYGKSHEKKPFTHVFVHLGQSLIRNSQSSESLRKIRYV